MRKSKMLKLDKKLRPWLKYYGDVPANMEYPNFSMVDLIIEAAEKYPNNMAYSYYGSKVSYKEFIVRIKRCAKALKNYGVKEGDNVTICMPNTPEGITMVYAVNMIGAICNMVHPLSSEKELEFYINAANSKYIYHYNIVCRIGEKAKRIFREKNFSTFSLIPRRYNHIRSKYP